MNEHEDNDVSQDRGMPDVSNTEKPLFLIASGVTAIFILAGFLLFKGLPREEQASRGVMEQEVEKPFDRAKVKQAPEVDESSFLEDLALDALIEKPAEPLEPVTTAKEAGLSEEQMYKRRRSPLVIYDQIRTKGELTDAEQDAVKRQDSNDVVDKILEATSTSQAAGSLGDDDLQSRLQSSKADTVKASLLDDADTLIAQGTMLKAVIETAISSDLPGMVRAVLTDGIYSEDGSNLLLTKGSRVIGEYRAGIVRGQARLFVVWHRIITPEGIDIDINSPGADPLGRSGHDGWIDTHFAKRFGASFLLSMVGAATSQTNDSQIAEQFGENLNSSAELALSSTIDIRPTLHKNQGEPISIFVAHDLSFKDVLMLSSR